MEEEKILLASMDPAVVTKEIGDFAVKTCLDNNADGAVIGLSGGVDSTATAILIKNGFDNCTEKDLELVAYIMPSSVNNSADAEDGIKVAEKLGVRYEVIPLDSILEGYKRTNPEVFNSQFHRGNLMSRIRANILSTKAATEGKLVAGTGNREEDVVLGYYTLFGDGAVHFRPIANLPKRLVRELVLYHGFDKDLAYREPTAGLEEGQSDFKDLGYLYDTVEIIYSGLVQHQEGAAQEYSSLTNDESKILLCNNSQIIVAAESDIKKYEQVFGKQKHTTVQDVVDDILRRHASAMKKEQIINPPAAPVTLIYQ
jgi:NAD+ synthase